MNIEKTNELIILFDIYGELLTDKQKHTFQLYFFDDYSLSEVADMLSVSRNAVHDQIKKASDSLYRYESVLGIHNKYKNRQSILEKMKKVDTIEEVHKCINDLEDIDQ